MNAALPGGRPLKPRYTLKVAVVGNRRFAGETERKPNGSARRMRAQAATACTVVWQAVVAAMVSAREERVEAAGVSRPRRDFFSDETPRLAVLSSLAAGADQIGVEAAFGVGRTDGRVAVELEATLPFSEADYPGLPGALRPEFRPEEAATLRRLASQACRVVRFEGQYDDRRARQRAYVHGRDSLLQHSDILMAIYDPRAIGGRAGTRETARLARAAGLPVVTVLVAEDEARVAVHMAGEDPTIAAAAEWTRACPLGDDRWRVRLRECIGRLTTGVRYLAAQLPLTADRDAGR